MLKNMFWEGKFKHLEGQIAPKWLSLGFQQALLGPSHKGLASKVLTRGAIRAKSFISLQLYATFRGGAPARVRENWK